MIMRKDIMDFYRECYDDAVNKNLGDKYLYSVYRNGKATYRWLEELAEMRGTTPMELLRTYRKWQDDEKLCEEIKNG